MNAHLFLAYCFAIAVFALIPGPIVTLVVANSLNGGSRSGLATVAGASIGNMILLCATAIGLVAFFALLSELFELLRWAGAVYLIWLGIRAWRTGDGNRELIVPAATRPSRDAFLQGLLFAITNPKAIVFYVAFLPQFLDSNLPAGPQLVLMIGAVVIITLVSDSTYALIAGRARTWFTAPGRRRLQLRITGSLLIGVGCGLLFVRRGR
jgi:homoserine/homoserine lactone efflux protein